MALTDEVREILKRRDPEGYFVIPVRREAVGELGKLDGILLEEAGEVVLVRTKSRSVAAKLCRRLARKGLLALG